MTDVELTRALERCEVPEAGFPHASHLRVAWVYLAESTSTGEAEVRMAATLRRFSASVGKADRYHHTITLFWMRLLALERLANPAADLDAVLTRRPALLDKHLLDTFYSPARLATDDARQSWIEPDLQPLT